MVVDSKIRNGHGPWQSALQRALLIFGALCVSVLVVLALLSLAGWL